MPDEAPDIESHGLSDTGQVRQDNQDAIRFCRPDDELTVQHGHLYGIADGMGGYAHGGIASALALEVLFKTFYASQGPAPQRLRQGVQDANLGIYQMAHRMGAGRMGTTLTAVHLSGHTLHVAHVGDSRAYLVRDREATCLTQDHTRVGELVRLHLLSRDKVRGHQQRSVLDKCLGLELFVQPDIFSVAVLPGDRIVLCTDGVWGFVEDQELAEHAAAQPSLEAFNRAVLAAALRGGSDDNLSLLTLRLRALAGEPEETPRRAWFRRVFGR
ncbi:MAG: protein phosphatase 2C domain-containing protein [Holophaga sp.]|nr:protein phosphatase 2C domain-containing protein [Holophaga sp.]